MNRTHLFLFLFISTLLALVLLGPATRPPASGAAIDVTPPLEETEFAANAMFIENVGQFAEDARFKLGTGEHTLWLADDGIWITILEERSPDRPGQGPR
ncbi:MAG TPA: hypothetical protein VK879_21640, partial [Candidatus Sulfomarinibacteraceae bacterium]|nr:hypothetical protein [Candidatus Sulfomarinibacteraceae bacterium]